MTAVRIVVSGKVQGVGYRAWVAKEARARGLTGWVRNLASGDVEAVFAGPDATLNEMVELCRIGPRLASVRKLTEEPVEGSGWPDFAIRPTE